MVTHVTAKLSPHRSSDLTKHFKAFLNVERATLSAAGFTQNANTKAPSSMHFPVPGGSPLCSAKHSCRTKEAHLPEASLLHSASPDNCLVSGVGWSSEWAGFIRLHYQADWSEEFKTWNVQLFSKYSIIFFLQQCFICPLQRTKIIYRIKSQKKEKAQNIWKLIVLFSPLRHTYKKQIYICTWRPPPQKKPPIVKFPLLNSWPIYSSSRYLDTLNNGSILLNSFS